VLAVLAALAATVTAAAGASTSQSTSARNRASTRRLTTAAPGAASALAVHLLEPADGTVLSGGTTATLAWEPGPGMSLVGVQEWEAFLSLDGGASWPIRITPHLDLGLRRVSFPIPAVPSREVRLLLRVGDESYEEPYAVAETFTIAARPSAILPAATIRYTVGESALPGGAGVVAWVEGTRQSNSLEAAIAVPLHSGWTGVDLVSLARFPVGAETNQPIHDLFPDARDAGITPVPEPRVRKPRPLPEPPEARDILLATERLDE